jgi:hypothetical protein
MGGEKLRRDHQSGECGGGEGAENCGSPPSSIRGRPGEIDCRAAGLERALRGQFRGMLKNGSTHRLARPARVEGRSAPIEVVDLVGRVLAWRYFVQAYSWSSSRSFVRA